MISSTSAPTCPRNIPNPCHFLYISELREGGIRVFHGNPHQSIISALFHYFYESYVFNGNYGILWNFTILEPQDMQNRVVSHTVSTVPALGGVQNHHFHEIPHISLFA